MHCFLFLITHYKHAWCPVFRDTSLIKSGVKKWRTNQLDEKNVSTSIVSFETCPAADATAKDRAWDVNVSNQEEIVETVYLED